MSDTTEGLAPPHDLEAEAAVLSAVMLDPDALATIEFLRPEHMYSEAHRQVLQAVLDLRDAGKVVDSMMIHSRLQETGRLAQVGGGVYLASIMDAAPVVRNVRAYAMTVVERWRLRRAIVAAQRLAAAGYASGVTDVQAFVEGAAKAFVELGRDNPVATQEKNWQIFRRMVDEMAAVSRREVTVGSGKTAGLPTGLPCLDRETMGLQAGQKTTLAAESGRGKTTMAIQLAMHAAGWRGRDQPLADRRVSVLFYSTEQTKAEVATKQLSLASRVDSRRLQKSLVEPTLTAEEWQRVMQALPLLERLAIFVDDRPGLTVDHIVSATKQAGQEASLVDGVPLGLVAVDYVQRLKPAVSVERKREDEQIGYSSQALKELAKSERIPVLELAQMNPPDPKLSPSGRPYQWLVSQCKRVEKEADHMWYLWRVKRDDKTGARITCTKQRGGDEFDLDLIFEPEYSRFYDPAYKGFQSTFGDL